MLTSLGRLPQSDSGLSRRSFLQLGVPVLGLGLADLLRGAAHATEAPLRTNSNKSVIVLWTSGGLSQQDTYDLKPEAPAEYRGMYRPIATSVPGISITERFPLQAQLMEHMSLVRSVHHDNGIHAPSSHWMLTGRFGPTLARSAPQHPGLGSVISRALGARAPQMPAYVTVPKSEGFGYQGAVYLGKANDPLEVGADPNAKDFQIPNLSLPDGLKLSSVESRRRLLKKFDTLRRDVDSSGVLDGLDTFKAQALEMVTGERVRKAFDINAEDPRLRDRYGRHTYGQSALLARRLIEAGSRCVTVNTSYWDHHDEIEKGLESQLPPLDCAIATLIADLKERGMLDDVLVFCAGEFGRTPLMNGHAGRDHWANCFSVMFAGGGLKGGQVIGSSEKRGGGVVEHGVTPFDLLATIYHTLGIPLETHYNDGNGRPTSIVDAGQPIRELI